MGDSPTPSAKSSDFMKNRGIIAQEAHEVLPEVVTVDQDTGEMGISVYDLLATTIAAVQELTARLEKLEKK
jgi:hypothetical protein